MSDPTQLDWLRRVEGLLAKAASTDFPEEAEALLAKAQQLMTRHSIEEAMLRPDAGSRSTVSSERVTVEPPYASAKATLLSHVGQANGCRVVLCGAPGAARTCAIFGVANDIARTTTMFAALQLHAVRVLLRTPVPDDDRPRRFRHAFLIAFAHRIGQRLDEAARQEAARSRLGPEASVAVVLRDRQEQVDAAMRAEFAHLRQVRPTASSFAGLRGGRTAADAADLGAPRVGSADVPTSSLGRG